MSVKFPKAPKCELCKKKSAIAFWLLRSDSGKSRWKFCCNCADEQDDIYVIMLDRFFHSPASTVDWLAHINEKKWMNWSDFIAMIDRFREATQSYEQL
jgi:hypothetical protein